MYSPTFCAETVFAENLLDRDADAGLPDFRSQHCQEMVSTYNGKTTLEATIGTMCCWLTLKTSALHHLQSLSNARISICEQIALKHIQLNFTSL